ncbi:cysteine--tRNA ligase [Solirubrobacter sp. CPCC 204708]|uniref:Cysteine--tRNA ligase n=1 Tax=Solirubrobacter deserti TaxID=2282478 RepID=A0ABT4RQ03_9ACTN|nr:cysteine--tRNA ligase [Solirubrobacter deserti]MBE2318310.1 cysteine--tRNA ligase [Solirubrobacter deserti]MDA0140648.1 cysteine--tRNA ligase [Solirubrobacter deserti]
MPDVTLYDTRTRSLQPFEPRDPARVGIYACGPTVYARVHVGNARPFVVFSQLKRFLEHEGYGVTLVGNVTDINDKIYTAATAAGVPSDELAQQMAKAYREDTDRIGLGRPDAEPHATEYVPHIIELIQRLLDTDAAYVASGDVYFRVRTVDGYGELSRRDLEQMDQGEGVEGADLKEDPLDFALWKAWKEGEDTSWDAPWGRGRPGWHIECSAMAEALLGVEFDIHGGGVDLVFPHHENEAAQTFAARGRPLAKIWMHNGMLELASASGEAEKMSKSVGNIRGLHEVLDAVGGDVLILFFSSGHYRQPLAFSDERLEDARRSAERIRDAARRLVPGPSPDALRPHRDAFFDALRSDFNTAEALASLYGWIRDANRSEETVGSDDLREMLDVLGLEGLMAADEGPPAEATELAEAREAARAAKDWAEADRLRDELLAMGWVVRDGPDGPELVPAS